MAEARGYDDLIMDHIRNARGYGVLDTSTHQANGINPLCGDEMTVYATLDGERIEAVAYQCSCCGISMASASMMTDALKGQSPDTARKLADAVKNICTGKAADSDMEPYLEKLAALSGVRQFPVRVKCATLGWNTLQEALKEFRSGEKSGSVVVDDGEGANA